MADPFNLPENDFLLAGELSLGVLEGTDAATARQRQLTDADFAAAVAWWEDRLACMAEAGGEITPSPQLLRGIHAGIDRLANDAAPVNLDARRSGPAGWSIALATLGAGLAAAALVLYLSMPTGAGVPVVPEQIAPTPQLVAQLQDPDNERRLTSVIDPATRRLALRSTGLEPGAGRIAELWVIPADGVPRSLGEIPGSGPFERKLSEAELGLLAQGAALAVTFERDQNIRHQAPTEPILLVGTLEEV